MSPFLAANLHIQTQMDTGVSREVDNIHTHTLSFEKKNTYRGTKKGREDRNVGPGGRGGSGGIRFYG
jgi:hypothetical protein